MELWKEKKSNTRSHQSINQSTDQWMNEWSINQSIDRTHQRYSGGQPACAKFLSHSVCHYKSPLHPPHSNVPSLNPQSSPQILCPLPFPRIANCHRKIRKIKVSQRINQSSINQSSNRALPWPHCSRRGPKLLWWCIYCGSPSCRRWGSRPRASLHPLLPRSSSSPWRGRINDSVRWNCKKVIIRQWKSILT